MIVYIMGNSDSVENHKQKKYYHKMFNWIPSFPTKEYDFINSENWDEARIFKSKTLLKNGLKAPEIFGKVISKTKIGIDKLTIMKPL